MLSIDIGKINLGFAILEASRELHIGILDMTHQTISSTNESLNNVFKEKSKRTNLKRIHSVVLQRGFVLKDFIESVQEVFKISKVIIERQSQMNPTAQEIEYMITGLFLSTIQDIVIFNPVNKFSYVGLKYDTKNKAHKKLSVNVITKLLEATPSEDFFKSLPKKDDVADAVYMAFVTDDRESLTEFIKNNGFLD